MVIRNMRHARGRPDSRGEYVRLPRKFKATVDSRPLLESLRIRYPNYSRKDLERLEDLIIEAVADAIREGKHVGFIDRSPDGEIELDALYVEDRARWITSRMGAS
jgi:hypothetical protein